MKWLKIILRAKDLPTKKEIQKKVDAIKKTPMISKMKKVAVLASLKKKS